MCTGIEIALDMNFVERWRKHELNKQKIHLGGEK